MDPRTLDAYERHARELSARDASITSPLASYFDIAFQRPGNKIPRILDVGSGSGRELAELMARGYDVQGVEPVSALRKTSAGLHPELVSRVRDGSLPGLTAQAYGEYDGIVCSAVIQHIPRSRLFDSVLDLRGLLKPHGRALISIPSTRGDVDADGRDNLGRLFTQVTREEIELLFERVGFVCLLRRTDKDAHGRSGFDWTTLLFEVRDVTGSRPIDQIATVIGTTERKVATYKLALLRALTEIATNQAHVVQWRDDERVGVPIEGIAARWVEYYWPLLAAPAFLPQQQGDHAKQTHGLGFASELRKLQQHYERRGGLSAYLFDRRNGLSEDVQRLHVLLMSALKRTIKNGPVTYAGGALESGRLFGYERSQVLVPVELWRELTLLGHWIADSIILRWAELVERLAKMEVKAADVLRYLLVVPDPVRDTAEVRKILDVRPHGGRELRCVWTDRKLAAEDVAIDHVIPWSLWRNNDLWNLVPAHASVNLQKSNQLPVRGLVRERKRAFLETWDIVHRARPERFRREAEGQIGHTLDRVAAEPRWLEELFDVMSESIESTRLQRGLTGWKPRATPAIRRAF